MNGKVALTRGRLGPNVRNIHADLIGHDPAVIQVQNRAQIELVDLYTSVVLKLGYVRQPLLIGTLCRKVTMQDILSDIHGISRTSGASLRSPLDRRLYVFLPADPMCPLVIDVDVIFRFQIVPKTAISFLRMFLMVLLHKRCNAFILGLTG
jgi:hypothetical protein